MNEALVTAALLGASLALLLGFAARRAALAGGAAFLVSAVLAALLLPAPDLLVMRPAAWAVAALVALGAVAGIRLGAAAAIAAGLLAGAAAGLIAQPPAAPPGALTAALAGILSVLLAWPARAVFRRGWHIALRVAASWLVAAALLAAVMPAVSTPGYVSDHMQ